MDEKKNEKKKFSGAYGAICTLIILMIMFGFLTGWMAQLALSIWFDDVTYMQGVGFMGIMLLIGMFFVLEKLFKIPGNTMLR